MALILSFVCVPLLGGQTTRSVVSIQSGPSGQVVCLDAVNFVSGPSSATCPVTPVLGGVASGSVVSDLASLIGTAKAQVQQSASTGNALVNADGRMNIRVDILGDKTHFGDTLVLHIATTVEEVFGGGLAPSNSFLLTDIFTPYGSWRKTFFADGTADVRLFGPAALTPVGLDLSIPFSFVGGTQSVPLMFFARAVLAGDQPAGVTLSESLDLRVSSAELVSFGGIRQAVVFDSHGTGTLVGSAITAPEPSSVVLTATVLVCVAVVARKRRVRAHERCAMREVA